MCIAFNKLQLNDKSCSKHFAFMRRRGYITTSCISVWALNIIRVPEKKRRGNVISWPSAGSCRAVRNSLAYLLHPSPYCVLDLQTTFTLKHTYLSFFAVCTDIRGIYYLFFTFSKEQKQVFVSLVANIAKCNSLKTWSIIRMMKKHAHVHNMFPLALVFWENIYKTILIVACLHDSGQLS